MSLTRLFDAGKQIAARPLLSAMAFALLSVAAFAHPEIQETNPVDGSVLGEVPANIVMTVSGDLLLTRVQMTHDDQASINLDLGDKKEFAARFELPLPDMGSGTYLIEWRGLAGDGHVMRGTFSFRVD